MGSKIKIKYVLNQISYDLKRQQILIQSPYSDANMQTYACLYVFVCLFVLSHVLTSTVFVHTTYYIYNKVKNKKQQQHTACYSAKQTVIIRNALQCKAGSFGFSFHFHEGSCTYQGSINLSDSRPEGLCLCIHHETTPASLSSPFTHFHTLFKPGLNLICSAQDYS